MRFTVRLVQVELHFCPNPDCRLKTSRHAYEGPRCPSCHPAVPPNPVQTGAQDRLVVMGERGVYVREARIRCAHKIERDDGTLVRCNNFYAAPECPMCGEPPGKGQKPKIVWVRAYPGGEPETGFDMDSFPGSSGDEELPMAGFSMPEDVAGGQK